MASLQHLRTSTDSKRPIPAAMAAGQLALGLHTNSPGAFFKDTNGGLVKIGPVHVGTTAPNASPASEAATATVSGRSYQILTVGNTDFTAIGASANTVGTIFTASGAGTGTGTVSGLQGNSKGESWLDTSVSPPVFKVFTGSAFVTVHPPHIETNTTTPPSNPVAGQLWWNKDDGRLYVYYSDGSSAQWVDASPDNQQLFWTRTGTRVDLSNSGDVVTISGGSASAPGLAVAGDLDTGISSSSANTLGISTGGTQRLLIDSSGRLGIATNSPSYKLHVAGAGTVAYFEGSGGSGFIGIEDTDDNTSAFIGVDGGSLKFQTSGNSYSDKLVIDSSGRVGINVSSPGVRFETKGSNVVEPNSINNFLTYGAFRVQTSSLSTDTKSLAIAGGSSGLVSLQNVNSSATAGPLAINPFGGNVTIGHPSVAFPSGGGLQVYNASTPRIKLTNSTTGTASSDGSYLYVSGSDFLIENKESANMRFYTAASQQLAIDSAGRLLVGTSSASLTNKFLLQGDTSNASNGGYMRLQTANSIVAGTGLGAIGFGDSAFNGALIEATGDVSWSPFTKGSRLQFSTTANGATSPTVRMHIDSSGPVGINNTSPGSYASDGRNLVVGSGSGSNGLTIASGSSNSGTIYFADGTSGASLYTGTITYNHASNYMAFWANESERMRIDSNGNVGIGRVPVNNTAGYNLQIRSATTQTYLQLSTSNHGDTLGDGLVIGIDNNTANIVQRENAPMIFSTNNQERMRVTSNGTLCIGRSDSVVGTNKLALQGDGSNTVIGIQTASNGTVNALAFFDLAGNDCGEIAVNGSTNTTNYSSTSDYRIKENVVKLADAIPRLNNLAPKRFNFINDSSKTTVDGFIAHEAQTVVPEAVVGTKDQVDDAGNPVMQGIDQSKLIPLLTAALQEAIAKIETLEQRLTDAGIA